MKCFGGLRCYDLCDRFRSAIASELSSVEGLYNGWRCSRAWGCSNLSAGVLQLCVLREACVSSLKGSENGPAASEVSIEVRLRPCGLFDKISPAGHKGCISWG